MLSWEGALQRAGAVGARFNSSPRPVSLALSRRKLVSSGQAGDRIGARVQLGHHHWPPGDLFFLLALDSL